MATRKTTAEWQRIEAEYLAGEDSIREIADRHEISDTAIRKRAKAEGWVRKVRSANKRELERQPPAAAADRPEQADRCGQIADGGRGLVARMLDELDVVTSRRGELEDMIEAATENGDEDDDRRDAMERAVSLPSRANTMKTLALALKTLNEASAPQGKKAAQQDKANEVANRFRGVGPPTLKAVNYLPTWSTACPDWRERIGNGDR
jgi:transposase-like protein